MAFVSKKQPLSNCFLLILISLSTFLMKIFALFVLKLEVVFPRCGIIGTGSLKT